MKSAYTIIVQLYCCFLLLICFTLFSTGCRKFINIDPPINEITSEHVFADEKSALSAVSGLYSQMMVSNLSFINGGFSVFCGLSADEIYNSAPNGTLDPFTANELLSTDGSVRSRFWIKGYEIIYQANAILEGLDRSSVITTTVKNQLSGEMKLARALAHFYLLQLFGDVPLITSTDYRVNALMPRTNSLLVYEQILADLESSAVLLPETYPSAERARPNRWTARALLARLYIYMEQWEKAETEVSAVIQSGLYSLGSNLNNVFISTSNETIWQLMSVLSGLNTAEGNAFVPGSATVKPTYVITNSLLAAFETGDQRKSAWTKANVVSGVSYFYPNKYKIRTGTVKTEHNIVIRLAELYLIRADARLHLSKITECRQDINIIRNRAGLVSLTSNDPATLQLAIEKERRIELFSEFGHRWLDLKRTGRVNAVLAPLKSGWQSMDALYPIPFLEIRANSNLVQNPGY